MIEDGKKVKFQYTLRVDGDVIEDPTGQDPIEYEQGSENVLPGLQKGLVGLKAGDRKEIILAAGEGYGEINPDLIIKIPKSNINAQNQDQVQVGTILNAKRSTGQSIRGHVQAILEDAYLVDFNHPLAGKELRFEVEIISVV